MFDLLIHLLTHRDRVVSKDDLFASVWAGRVVSDSTLTSRINAARRAIGDSGEDQKLIRTVARKGFRFVGSVQMSDAGADNADVGSAALEGREPWRPIALHERPAIAVLPFTNMSGDPEQE
ncbi:MAG TPA: winged helix-turn-helix domain-containing protein, partial [Gemmata sp.]|nr:winged helix-turn-helix domain-containing protein [Gemmata sp.]